MYKAFKYKLKPNKEQIEIFSGWLGSSRWIWNWALSANKMQYELYKKFIFKFDLKKELPRLKEQFSWLKEIPSQALQNKILDFDLALTRVWKQGNGFPKYKSKKNDESIRIDQMNGHIKPNKTQIKIPKIGWVKWNKHRPLEGKLKHITIKQENNDWYVVCVCELPDKIIDTNICETDILGIDMGFKDFITDNLGNKISTPKFYMKWGKKLKRKQKQLSRKKKGSKNRLKNKDQVRKIHLKIRNKRYDFLHKTSMAIAKQYKLVGVEDLNIEAMKKRYGKTINDLGWSSFIHLLSYKTSICKIGRFYPSSQICHSCGNKKKMPLEERVYKCSCGVSIDRDHNAAINIRREAIKIVNRNGTFRIQACGDASGGEKAIDFSSYVSEKQEKILAIGKEACSL